VSSKVLIVDDDDLNREIMEAFLSLNGYYVLIAGNGARAIELSQAEQPDIIVLDLRLPDMSGLKVIEVLRNNTGTKEIPILMITGMSDPKIRQQALQAGVNGYMQRPFDGDDFVSEVDALLTAN